MERIKIGKGYNRRGYGRGFFSKPNIYLINGKAYAKDQNGYESLFDNTGVPYGYVPVNCIRYTGWDDRFYEVAASETHVLYEIK